ncbi:MAG TPA: carboxypeptidase-like regulatory domain-containing protein [Candidatus Saccharimonadales bacterium]|nr:carboxypeptidase-like regulatory domain-containing protein [Candidatus Saccharimonadales bacterium]
MKKLAFFLFFLLFFIHPLSGFADTSDITVNASVNPHPSDFQLSISSNPTSAITVNQFQNIVYTITYGSHVSYATPITITAFWDDGTIQGQSSPSVSIADYVIGSATNGYNNTPAVVDTVNKTITWTISSFPANTINQTVSFNLQTNDSYKGAQTVTFPTTARLTESGTTVPGQSGTMTYQYNPAITPSPTPTLTPPVTPTPTQTSSPNPSTPSTSSGPTAIPTEEVTMTPTPTAIPINPLTITTVSVETISPTNATIHVTTSAPSTMIIQYGTSPGLLHQTSGEVTGIDQIITLANLQPNTRYYFRVIVKSGEETVTSEIFTFTTATTPTTIQVDKTSLIVTSGSTLLYSVVVNADGRLHETIVLPVNKPFQFTFSLAGNNDIKKVIAFVRNNHVLGVNTFDQQPPENNIKLFEIQPQVYQGLLTSSKIPGIYGLYIHVFDTKGNIREQQLFSIKVIRPLTILSQQTKKPIEHAQVTLYRLDIASRKFARITPQMFAIQNPSYSTLQGEVPFVLPQGKYQVVIDTFGYAEKKVAFTIGPARDEDYPVIYLEKAGLSLETIRNSIGSIFGELSTATNTYAATIGNAKQFSLLICSLTVLLFVILSLLSLSFRFHTNIFLLPWLLWHYLKRLLFNKSNKIVGKVIDEVAMFPLSNAAVTIIDADKNQIIYTMQTNPAGEFSFAPTDATTYKIAIEKNGYEQHPFFEFLKESITSEMLFLPIKKEEQAISIGMYISHWITDLLSLSLEIILITTFLLEILFGMYLGWISIFPFLIISLLNFILLIITKHSRISTWRTSY